MGKQLFSSPDAWIAFGLLALSLSMAVGHLVGPSNTSDFVQGVLVGVSIVANAVGIVQLSTQPKQRSK